MFIEEDVRWVKAALFTCNLQRLKGFQMQLPAISSFETKNARASFSANLHSLAKGWTSKRYYCSATLFTLFVFSLSSIDEKHVRFFLTGFISSTD
jgi:hypothetical protein